MRDEFKNRKGNEPVHGYSSVIIVAKPDWGCEGGGYEDLLQPELKGRIAMCDPATSSSAYEHL